MQKLIPAFLANLIANNLPKLERWKNK